MPSKVVLLAFVLASVFAFSAALQCYDSPFGSNSQPTSDNYTASNCTTGETYCFKWTSKDFKYTGRGCQTKVASNIVIETGGDPKNGAIPDCSKVDSNSYKIKDSNGKVLHEGTVYCCKKDLCNGAAFGAPTLATLLLGVIAAMWAKA